MPARATLLVDEQGPFERLFRTVTRSPRFSLSFAVVNSPLQRERLLRALTDTLTPGCELVPVHLEASVAPGVPETLLGEAAGRLKEGGIPGKQVLCVWGIEKGLGDPQTASRILSSLNREREQFPRRLNVPLVLWLPEFALERIAREAPDFWAWRSGVFTFPEDLATVRLTGQESLALPAEIANLTAEEKRRRIIAHQDLLKKLGTGGEAAGRAAAVQLEIAHLHRLLGETEEALAAYREVESLAHAAGDTGRMLEAAAAAEGLTRGSPTKEAAERLHVSAEQAITAPLGRERAFGPERAEAAIPTDLVLRVCPVSGWKYAICLDGSASHEIDLALLSHRPSPLLRKDPEALRTLGRQLTQAMFMPGSPAENAWKEFHGSTGAGRGRLVLDLEGADASMVPWEYAADSAGRLISLDYEIVRRVRQPAHRASTTPRGPVRLLIVESDPLLGPGNSERVPLRIDVGKETEELVNALRRTGRQYVIRRVVPPTIKALHLELSRQGLAIVHFNGHGSIDREPILCFEEETGRLDPVPTTDFVSRTSGQAWLVVLSACFSAAVPEGRTAALAHALADAGVPWVIGMQDAVPVDEARTFVEMFYRYLAEGHPVWEAVRQARIALWKGNWAAGLPVVYASGDDPGMIPAQPQGEVRDETAEERARLGWREDLGALREATHFFGRERELVRIGEALAWGGKLVSLSGPGGIGKSALAHQVARRFGWRFPAGVYSVTLANVKEPVAVSAILLLGRQILGPKFAELSFEAQEHQLIEAIRSLPCLVVVDNAEDALWSRHQSIEATRSLRTLRAATGGQGLMLVTSQENLAWPGEKVIEVAGLDPRSSRELLGLFLGDWKPTQIEERLLARLLERIEHHPLAIRLLAPAWLESGLGLDELDSKLDSLLGKARDELAETRRHISLDACFRYAYEALDEEHRNWLGRLGLFRAPFRLDAAVATFACEEATLLPILLRLAKRSFLWKRPDDAPRPFLFGFQPQIRPFVSDQVSAEGRDLSDDTRRFAAVHASMVADSVNVIDKAEWEERYPVIMMTLPNLIQAVEWTEEASRAPCAFNLAKAVNALGLYDLAMRLYQEVLEIVDRLGDLQGKGATLHATAGIHVTRGDLDKAMRLYQGSLEIKDRLGNLQGKGTTLHEMAYIHRVRGHLDEAMRLYQESLAIKDRLGDLRGKGLTLYEMAGIHVTRGHLDEAMRLYQESLGIDERLGDLRGKGATLREMAGIHVTRGDLDKAMRLYQESLEIKDRLGDLQGKGATLAMMGQLLIQSGEIVRGIRTLLGSLHALAHLKSAEIGKLLDILGTVREQIGEERFASVWQEATGEQSIPDWIPGRIAPKNP